MGKPGPQQAEAIRCLRLWGPGTQKVPQSRELQKLFSILGSLGAKSQGPELFITQVCRFLMLLPQALEHTGMSHCRLPQQMTLGTADPQVSGYKLDPAQVAECLPTCLKICVCSLALC